MASAPSTHAPDFSSNRPGTTCDRTAGGISSRFREFVNHNLCQLTHTVQTPADLDFDLRFFLWLQLLRLLQHFISTFVLSFYVDLMIAYREVAAGRQVMPPLTKKRQPATPPAMKKSLSQTSFPTNPSQLAEQGGAVGENESLRMDI
jgi:hypothetical protein